MKKIFKLLLLVALIPTMVFAKNNYEAKSLEEALKDEKIEYNLGDYEESDDKATIYLFRGKGCSHCYEFLEYVANDLIKEKGQFFKVVTYEVWNNKNNAALMNDVADYMGDDAGGVPYIIIGDKSFSGYSKTMNSEIEDAIEKLYNSEDRYDVISELEKNPKAKKEKKDNTFTIVFVVFASLAIIILVATSLRKRN